MIERYVRISNFRSIGNGENEHLELNYLMDKNGSYGGLVTLIGENNSGKSNFLDALKAFENREFIENDIPFSNLDNTIQPTVSIVLHNKKTRKKLETKLKNGSIFYKKLENGKEVKDVTMLNLKMETIKFIEYILGDKHKEQAYLNINRRRNYNSYYPIAKKIIDKQLLTKEEIQRFSTNLLNSNIKPVLVREYPDQKIIAFIEEIKERYLFKNISKIMQNESLRDFDVKVLPNIITYIDNQKITNEHTLCNVSAVKPPNTKFLKKLFDLLDDEKLSSLQTAYQRFFESGKQRKSILTNYQTKLNKSVSVLSNLFNKIYTFENNEKYSFRMVLESNDVYFMISENGEDIHLNSQSTGFRWFFDFFFNVFANKNLEKGDIVLLDEPATNLHVAGQIELRKQIKEFGMQNGITFVMSTHSPFLIDPDYFDELRVVSKVEQKSIVQNKFTITTSSDVDVMMPIKTALTVNRHIIMNPDDVLIFVEGITDYNYLVAFKELLGIRNVRFMPVQGIKRGNLYSELIKITKTPILLVDSDGAGNSIYNKNKGKVGFDIFKLSDIDENFKEIEDLFSMKDKETFYVKDKDYKVSSGFKNAIVMKKVAVEKETKDNFEKLLKYIIT